MLQSKEWYTETDHLDPAYMCVLRDGGGDGDRGCIAFDTQVKVSIKRFLKRNLAHVGLAQCMNALADKVHKQEVPCLQ